MYPTTLSRCLVLPMQRLLLALFLTLALVSAVSTLALAVDLANHGNAPALAGKPLPIKKLPNGRPGGMTWSG